MRGSLADACRGASAVVATSDARDVGGPARYRVAAVAVGAGRRDVPPAAEGPATQAAAAAPFLAPPQSSSEAAAADAHTRSAATRAAGSPRKQAASRAAAGTCATAALSHANPAESLTRPHAYSGAAHNSGSGEPTRVGSSRLIHHSCEFADAARRRASSRVGSSAVALWRRANGVAWGVERASRPSHTLHCALPALRERCLRGGPQLEQRRRSRRRPGQI